MKQLLSCIFLFVPITVYADAIAEMPNKAGGKIVLTDEVCRHEGKSYDSLNRAYNYSQEGYTSEGCFKVEDSTVVVVWKTGDGRTMRYPIASFTLVKQKTTRYGT